MGLRQILMGMVAVIVGGADCKASGQEASSAVAKERMWSASGRVVDTLTGAPLHKANVTLTSGEGRTLSTITDQEGEFELTGEMPGHFRLAAERSGYLRGEYGSRSPQAPGIPVRLDLGQRVTRLEVRLTPPASISGRVYDEEGQPLARVSVQILTQQYRRGRKEWIPSTVERTNDRGEYRAYGLQPGKYIVAAQALVDGRPATAAPPKPSEPEMAYGLLFYPNGEDLAQAQVLDLSGGSDLSAIDLALRKSRVFRATGRVEQAAEGGHLMVARQGTAARSSFSLQPDGTFELRNLEPGTYSLLARLDGGAAPLIAQTTLTVTDRDIDGLVLHPSAGYTLTGRLNFSAAQLKDQPQASVSLVSQDAALVPAPSARVGPDGFFGLKGVLPGRYRLETHLGDKSAYLKAANLSGTDILDKEFEIAGPASFAISVGFDSSTIMGTVRLNEQPAPGVTAVLIPAGVRRSIPTYYKTARTGTDGRFQFEGVVPGEYQLLAFDNLEIGEWFESEFIRQYESKAVKVTAVAAGHHNADLEVIGRK